VIEKTADPFCSSDINIREIRPFYWVLMAVLAAMYAWIVISTPGVRELGRLIPFTGLMLVHMALHWISPQLTLRSRWLLPYFALQGAMAFALSLVSGNQGVTLGLYLGLAGEAVGIYEDLRASLPAVVGLLALSAVNFVVLSGFGALGWWFASVAPTAFFVVVYVASLCGKSRRASAARCFCRNWRSPIASWPNTQRG
jgi:NarL family two-component system sensor histidine kinase YdfH